jgi:hypothetical protein
LILGMDFGKEPAIVKIQAKFYAADHWVDMIRVVKERKKEGANTSVYFDSEQEAKNYLIERASAAVLEARIKLAEAESRLAKCKKKYGPHDGKFVSPLLKRLPQVESTK